MRPNVLLDFSVESRSTQRREPGVDSLLGRLKTITESKADPSKVTSAWFNLDPMDTEAGQTSFEKANHEQEKTDLTKDQAGKKVLEEINAEFRITLDEDKSDSTSYAITLQRFVQNANSETARSIPVKQQESFDIQWISIASYQSRRGHTVRYLNRKSGERQQFNLELPAFVVKNMALQDFKRNYQNYYADYTGKSSALPNSGVPTHLHV